MLFFIQATFGFSQLLAPQRILPASELQLEIRKLNVVGSVLYFAAHPDDENTRIIAYLSKHELLRTAYLSLTRGDGGQNLIGSEQGQYLGLIRTQELLQARKTDGAEQYFSRANDFGYSKTPTESLSIWDKQRILADAVWTIRKFRPDVIITRFHPNPKFETHGHHTASAMLALEAFHAAADPKQFPEQLQYVQIWQTKRILANVSSWFFADGKFNPKDYFQIDAGLYNSFIGKSYGEIAVESRTMHQSQGMGAEKNRGSQMEYFELLAGEKIEKSLHENIDLTWKRIEGGAEIGKLLVQANKEFNFEKPSQILPILLKAYQKIEDLEKKNNDSWLKFKKNELQQVIRNCAGLWFEVTADSYSAVAGGKIAIKATAIKRSEIDIKIESVEMPFSQNLASVKMDSVLKNNLSMVWKQNLMLKKDLEVSQPYWLKEPASKGMFEVKDQLLIGLAENVPQHTVKFNFDILGTKMSFSTPILHKYIDRVTGEWYRPFEITPDLTANIQEQVYVFANDLPKKVNILLKADKDSINAQISLKVPNGWKISPESQNVSFALKNEEKTITFELFPSKDNFTGTFQVLLNGQTARSLKRIEYPHIPPQVNFAISESKIVRLDIKTRGTKIGYYVGAGDEIPASLRQIGYQVTELNEDNFDATDLTQFDAIVTGVRAYNVRKRIKFDQEKMLEYVKNGGNLIIQYNVNSGLLTDKIGAFPFKLSNTRVSVEEAPVSFLNKDHALLNVPNQITDKDFEGWIQERGIYFASEWNENYEAILSCNDPNEPERKGGLLFSKHGKGAVIYTGYAFFRQLPAGVAGAYRLFANLISYKNEQP